MDEQRAVRPHEVWEMDASEQIRLLAGRPISWLRLADEFSGAVLQTTVYAEPHFNAVPPRSVQVAIRQAFSAWGRPAAFRVDNGAPWGSAGDFPTDLALWLIGAEIDVIWNPPCRPEKNGVVERAQGTGKRWAEPATCATPAELQRRLDEMDRLQREEYPYAAGQSRSAVFPELWHSGRAYDATWEQHHWSFTRVVEYLSDYVVTRRVDQAGMISLYNQGYYVGKQHRAQAVQVFLDPTTIRWIIADTTGNELRTHAADQITAKRIQSLEVTLRRNRKPK